METKPHNNQGIKLLVKRFQNEFQCQENTDYYDDVDYQAAERKFVKHCLFNEFGDTLP